MEAYQRRVVDEKTELDAKHSKLVAFIESNPAFASLPSEDQQLLCGQAQVMKEYSQILANRIARF